MKPLVMNPLAIFSRSLLALSLAIGVGGCSGLPGLLAGNGLGPYGQQALEAGMALTADSLAAVNTDEELDRGAAVAMAASRTTQSVSLGAEATASVGAEAGASSGAEATASGEAGAGASSGAEATASGEAGARLETQIGQDGGLALRIARIEARVASQLEALKKIAEIKPPEVTTNDDGSVTTRFEITLARPHNSTHIVATRTVDAQGRVVTLAYEAEKSNKAGHKATIHRERKVNADGTWQGSFESKLVRRDGKEKTVKWTITGALDGSEQAEGEIRRFDGSVVSLSIVRSADGTVTVVTRDTAARIRTEARKADLASSAEVKIVAEASSATLNTVEISDTTAVEASDR